MSDLNRRRLLRYGAAATIVAATAGGAQSLAAPGSAAPPPEKDPRDFETEHNRRKIKGQHDKKTKKHKVTIDGMPLGVVEIELPAGPGATGTVTAVISALTHFEPFLLDEDANKDGLLKMTRKAVDTLGDAHLTEWAGKAHDH
jgi:hypothetical protein